MDFDQLHTFLEIVRLKSFSKAALTCYRTQPAISAQVRQLEQELRADLFERFGSRISLTTAGKIFTEYAEQMLDLRRRVQDAIAELETNPRGELVIAANEATCIYVLPKVFSEYREQIPAVQLQALRREGFRGVEAAMESSMWLDSTGVMKHFVVAGLGVSFVAASNCREEIAAGKLQAVPLAPEPMIRRLGVIYRKDKALSKAALGFIQVVLDHVGEESKAEKEKPKGPRVVAS